MMRIQIIILPFIILLASPINVTGRLLVNKPTETSEKTVDSDDEDFPQVADPSEDPSEFFEQSAAGAVTSTGATTSTTQDGWGELLRTQNGTSSNSTPSKSSKAELKALWTRKLCEGKINEEVYYFESLFESDSELARLQKEVIEKVPEIGSINRDDGDMMEECKTSNGDTGGQTQVVAAVIAPEENSTRRPDDLCSKTSVESESKLAPEDEAATGAAEAISHLAPTPPSPSAEDLPLCNMCNAPVLKARAPGQKIVYCSTECLVASLQAKQKEFEKAKNAEEAAEVSSGAEGGGARRRKKKGAKKNKKKTSEGLISIAGGKSLFNGMELGFYLEPSARSRDNLSGRCQTCGGDEAQYADAMVMNEKIRKVVDEANANLMTLGLKAFPRMAGVCRKCFPEQYNDSAVLTVVLFEWQGKRRYKPRRADAEVQKRMVDSLGFGIKLKTSRKAVDEGSVAVMVSQDLRAIARRSATEGVFRIDREDFDIGSNRLVMSNAADGSIMKPGDKSYETSIKLGQSEERMCMKIWEDVANIILGHWIETGEMEHPGTVPGASMAGGAAEGEEE